MNNTHTRYTPKKNEVQPIRKVETGLTTVGDNIDSQILTLSKQKHTVIEIAEMLFRGSKTNLKQVFHSGIRGTGMFVKEEIPNPAFSGFVKYVQRTIDKVKAKKKCQ